MIQISKSQEAAFARLMQTDGFDALESVFKAEHARVTASYDVSKEMLVRNGDNRTQALQLLGRKSQLEDVLDLFKRQRA